MLQRRPKTGEAGKKKNKKTKTKKNLIKRLQTPSGYGHDR